MSRISMLGVLGLLGAAGCMANAADEPADGAPLMLAPGADGHLTGRWSDGTTTITLEAASFPSANAEGGVEVDGRLLDASGMAIAVQGSRGFTPAWLDAAEPLEALDADRRATHAAAVAALPAVVDALDAAVVDDERASEKQVLLELARGAAKRASAAADGASTTAYGNVAIGSWAYCPRPTWSSEVMTVRACNTGSQYQRANQWNWYTNWTWIYAVTEWISPGHCASHSLRAYGSDISEDNNVSSTIWAFSFATDNYCSQL